MVITYHGDNYFKIVSGEKTILLDPTNQRSFRGANIVVSTERSAKVLPPPPDAGTFWIDHAGEYEIEGVIIRGWRASGSEKAERTMYRIEFEGIRLAILGFVTGEPSAEFQEGVMATDIAIVPAGGKPLISEKAITTFIRQIEPGIIIPSLFSPKSKQGLKPFLKELGENKCAPEQKLVLKKKDIKPGAMKVRCLQVV